MYNKLNVRYPIPMKSRGAALLAVGLILYLSDSLLVSGGVYGGGSQNALGEGLTAAPSFQQHGRNNNNGQTIAEPYFDAQTPKVVTALVAKSAYLTCRVRNLGNRTVSWIRHRDLHILTVGGYTYTSDQRFQATFHRDTEDWTLQIKWAQKRDAGTYECQVSTQPVTSHFVDLKVVETQSQEPQPNPSDQATSQDDLMLRQIHYRKNDKPVPTAAILGGPDLHVDKGSTINLTCAIHFSPEPPAYIFWYHHDEVISYDSSRGGVSVITEKGEVTTSYLLIQHADLPDSGKYSCSPSNADVASVRVHVLNGERPAAMQTASAGLSNSSLNIIALIVASTAYGMFFESLYLSPER